MTNEEATKEEMLDILYRLRTDLVCFVPRFEAQNKNALNIAIKALEQTIWTPVSERLPKELEPVNITWVNHNPESYYADIKDKPFTATGVYFNGQWYWWSSLCIDILAEYSHNYDDVIDDDVEIIAWQPLPKPYKEKQA